MAIQPWNAVAWVPDPFYQASHPIFQSMTMNGNNTGVAFGFPCPKDGSIQGFRFTTGTVTTGATVDCRLETTDNSTGLPSGTLVSTNSNASLVINNSDDNVELYSGDFTANASVTAGQFVWAVIRNPGSSAGNINVQQYAYTSRYPFCATHNGTSWSASGQVPNIAIRYTDGYVFIPGTMFTASITNRQFTSGTNPDERGIRFQVPSAMRLFGAWATMTTLGNQTITIRLYDDADSVLTSVTMNGRHRSSTNPGVVYVPFDNAYDLDANTTYRLTFRPDANDIILVEFAVSSTAVMGAMPFGDAMYDTTRNNDGGWTDTTTARLYMGLLISGADDAAGGGGGGGGLLTHPGMSGGLRG